MSSKVKTLLFASLVSFVAFALILSCTGNGEVESTDNTDTSDSTPPSVVQTIPPGLSTGIDLASVISLFFDDAIRSASINTSSIQITEEPAGSTIAGQYFTALSQAGNSIVTFVPSQLLLEDSQIKVYLPVTNGVQDDGGNNLLDPYEFTFDTGSTSVPLAASNLGFEENEVGLVFVGDAARLNSAQEDITVNEGSFMVAISTDGGYGGVVSATPALLDTTSIFSTGSITLSGGETTLLFDYDFVSAEFNEFVGTEFDDTFIVAVRGPSGILFEVVASVNQVGTVALHPVTLPASYLLADSELDPFYDGAGRTGWQTKSFDISTLGGGPIYVTFTVSDIGDEIYSTIIFIDNIRVQ